MKHIITSCQGYCSDMIALLLKGVVIVHTSIVIHVTYGVAILFVFMIPLFYTE